MLVPFAQAAFANERAFYYQVAAEDLDERIHTSIAGAVPLMQSPIAVIAVAEHDEVGAIG